MTWSKFHKNCIFTGLLDGFCLVCEDHMKNDDDYIAHIEKQIHKKNLHSTLYFEKYKQDCIRKVKKGYYCEICNDFFLTASKVGLHIAEAQHVRNKAVHLLRRVDNNNVLIAFENVHITDKAWNGFIDHTCVVCNVEFDDMLIHKTRQDHVLNLIMKNVQFGDEEWVYRKIDESSYQCLTCNLIMASDTFSCHSKDVNHKAQLSECRKSGDEALKLIEKKPVTKTTIQPTNETRSTPTNGLTTQTANIAKDTKEVFSDKNKNKTEGNAKTKKPEKISRDNIKNALEMDKYICTVLRTKNYITPIQDGKSMCILCDWILSDNRAIPAHVTGRHHLTLLKMHKERLENMSKTEQTIVTVEDAATDDSTKDDDVGKVLDSIQDFQKNDINVNFESRVATCKKCSKTFDLRFDVLMEHIEEHKAQGSKGTKKNVFLYNETKKKENGTSLYTKPVLMKGRERTQSRASSTSRDDEQIEIFAKENNMNYMNGKVTCLVCDSKLSASLKFLKEHVDGAQHKRKATRKTTSTSLTVAPFRSQNVDRVPASKFTTSLISFKDFFINGIVVNEKYCLNMLSYLMITTKNNVFKCELCDEEIPSLLESEVHKLTERHQKGMNDTMVLISISGPLENEFIREPRSGVYHCGFCSEVATGWEVLLVHLESTSHKESRTGAEWRLRERTPDIMRAKWQENVQKNLLSMMMGQFRGRDDSSDDDEWY